jgi:hypothetical protein
MKKYLLTTYLFLFAGGSFAQRKDTVVAEIDFNRPTILQFTNVKQDTVRATLLITRGHMNMAHEKPGYVVYRSKDTVYLDDRKMVLKAPVKVWAVKREK